jgi:hypothetical protein
MAVGAVRRALATRCVLRGASLDAGRAAPQKWGPEHRSLFRRWETDRQQLFSRMNESWQVFRSQMIPEEKKQPFLQMTARSVLGTILLAT